MKIKYAPCLLLLAGLVSCKKYLGAPVDTRLTPVTVEDYASILNGEGWNRQLRDSDMDLFFLDILTDDIDESIGENKSPDLRGPYSAFYTWQNNYDVCYDERGSPSTTLNNTWLGLYRLVRVCNTVMEAESTMKGDKAAIQYLVGESKFSRAMAYFYLVNIWGHPYDPGNPGDKAGVPLKITSGPTDHIPLSRSSVSAVYDQITEDLVAAGQNILASGQDKNFFHYSPEAVYLLLSRVYLYRQRWEQALEYANKCLDINASLYDISTTKPPANVTSFFNADNPEIIYTFYNTPDNISELFSNYSSSYRVPPQLMQLYAGNDGRVSAYFISKPGTATLFPRISMGRPEQNGCSRLCFRTSEAYLNRAEANARLGKIQDALNDLNLLRSKRIKDAIPVAVADQTSLLQEILLERRRELVYQAYRWFDLRRTGRPEVTHYFTPVKDDSMHTPEKFVLHKNDPGYTLELPGAALEANPLLTPLGLGKRMPE